MPEVAQYGPYYIPLNVFTASKGSNFYILFPGCIGEKSNFMEGIDCHKHYCQIILPPAISFIFSK